MPQKILLLHGNRQTGQVLLGRMERLRKKLLAVGLELVAPDALFPHPEDVAVRQWWNRVDNAYLDLDVTLQQIASIWMSAKAASSSSTPNHQDEHAFVGVMGFSMGARLAHLLAVAHSRDPNGFLQGLQFVIMVAGYDAPLPDGFDQMFAPTITDNFVSSAQSQSLLIQIPSLHVYGETDRLIEPALSQAVMNHYEHAESHVHAGGHHVPMQAESTKVYLDFIDRCRNASVEAKRLATMQQLGKSPSTGSLAGGRLASQQQAARSSQSTPAASAILEPEPDDETKQIQTDEVEALTAIFPEEVTLLSKHSATEGTFESPIQYTVDLTRSDIGTWPPRPLKIQFTYPYNYPETAIPKIKLIHDMNVMEFSYGAANACIAKMEEAAQAEQVMPSVMSCIYAARDFFESDGMLQYAKNQVDDAVEQAENGEGEVLNLSNAAIIPASPERIEECTLRGLSIAESLLRLNTAPDIKETDCATGKGGSWVYTIGLVGKPSAGKSTFFNAATAFARQRDDHENALGGAAMAPHPFTTIDPNTGCALVPAPFGSCPEDDFDSLQNGLTIGNTHGRDMNGRRLIPVLLKDVAGLVPGAYQGRGRGNKFLNDLCDADVLIHVMDASGTADTEGNHVGVEEDGMTPCSGASNPLKDLAWIRKELIEWVYTNLLVKWDTIKRKGRSKLEAMFNGYGQKSAVTWSILNAVEKEMERIGQREKPLNCLDEWDEGDVHLLVSAFLGVRFPMVLALNKCDLPSSRAYIDEILTALPAHGAHIGVPVCAREEMSFIKETIQAAIEGSRYSLKYEKRGEPPVGVWQCLQSALTLKEPVLVFPVADFVNFAPLPGLSDHVTSDASLPRPGMIACLEKAGGSVPSSWDTATDAYSSDLIKKRPVALRDVLIMKPGSTIEDVFLTLKRPGALYPRRREL
ncbi:hypothetical protein MPSEU_001002200 [Mayamaea pseudoterrestris]|nr:hypothetical protein MPSEU_001002200 [Mayamaea pseudoterrestris]